MVRTGPRRAGACPTPAPPPTVADPPRYSRTAASANRPKRMPRPRTAVVLVKSDVGPSLGPRRPRRQCGAAFAHLVAKPPNLSVAGRDANALGEHALGLREMA